MNIDIGYLKSITKHKIIYPVLLLGIINLGIIIGIFFIGKSLYQKFQTLQTEKEEITKLKARIVLVRNNKEIFNDRIDEYNETLGKLIPDQESYFSVITALEQLANRTGVSITSYTIDIKSTTEEKLTLTLNIQGDQQALNKLLSEYMFISGRLITNEESSILLNEVEKNLNISFNFLHKEFKDAVSPASKVTEKDIQFLQDIKNKDQ